MNEKITAELRTLSKWLAVAILAGSVFGCAGTPPRNPLPLELTNRAVIPGIPEARFWGDEWPRFSMARFATFSDADFQRYFPAIYDTEHSYLAISGGGQTAPSVPVCSSGGRRQAPVRNSRWLRGSAPAPCQHPSPSSERTMTTS